MTGAQASYLKTLSEQDHRARNRQLHRFLRIGRGIGYGFCGDLLHLLSFAFKFQERFAGACDRRERAARPLAAATRKRLRAGLGR